MTSSSIPRVVVGVDGSAESLAALDWAAEFSERFGHELRVVVAWHLPTPYLSAVSALREVDLEAAAGDVTNDAVEAVTARRPDLKIVRAVVAGAPGKVLVAESRDAGLLVVGTRRTLGSVSSYCAHHAWCPVVIIRREGDPVHPA
jgi:nucleotide-binding universal stress UspA family protein